MLSHPDDIPDLHPYRAIGKIGEGGTGCVYLAEEPGSSVQVALKVLHPEFVQQRALVDNFLHVAKHVGQLGHPSIVKVLKTGFLNAGWPFVAMEYLAGRDLGDLLAQKGSLDYRQVMHIARQVCAGLAAVHGQGVLHLDIKPNNIFILESSKEYVVKLLDFGSAKLFTAQKESMPGAPRDQMVLGTPEYWSPEQACGQSLDQRSDVYSLGVVMYEALSGKPPFGRIACRTSSLSMYVLSRPDWFRTRMLRRFPSL
jgi:eukaryotic-like serine/threonine-protein kinase